MFNSTVLEVAIGLAFCYASVALMASSIYEAIASGFNLRSKTLLNGIQSLLNANDPGQQELLLGIYNHALANPLGDGVAATLVELKNKPSYIDAKHFSAALIDTIQAIPGDNLRLREDIDAIENPQLRRLLLGMYNKSAGNIENLHAELANWFDSGMDRLSGSYKRQSQLWCFVIALFLAGIFNIDSLHLFETLWEHPTLVAQITASENATIAPDPHSAIYQNAVTAMDKLKTLPIGWDSKGGESGFCTLSLIGWLITASAALFGGPFWFDILKQLINLRGTGAKPEKSAPAQAGPLPLRTASVENPELLGLRNSIINLHAAQNQNDESYRPIQAEEHW